MLVDLHVHTSLSRDSNASAEAYLTLAAGHLPALDVIEKSHTRVVIITGAGKAFCAGMDLEMLAAIAKQSPAENQEDSRRIAKMLRRIWSFPRPLIAAVNGAAYAGGCGIATLCDFTLATPDAKFGYTEVRIGFLPALVSVFLTRQIGEKRARDLLLTGRHVGAQEMKEIGLVNDIVPAESLMARAHELADVLIAASPSSLTRAKWLLTSAAAAAVDHDLERAVLENARIRCTPDSRIPGRAAPGRRHDAHCANLMCRGG